MLVLLRVTAHNDHKGRPNVGVTILCRSENWADLVAAMDSDVLLIQKEDVSFDIECWDGVGPRPDGTWDNGHTRFEMQLSPDEDMRQLVYVHGDGGAGSVTYHAIKL